MTERHRVCLRSVLDATNRETVRLKLVTVFTGVKTCIVRLQIPTKSGNNVVIILCGTPEVCCGADLFIAISEAIADRECGEPASIRRLRPPHIAHSLFSHLYQ